MRFDLTPSPHRLILIVVLALAGCVSVPHHRDLAAPSPAFSANSFFDGETLGEGMLDIDVVGRRATHVVGHGHVEMDGTLVLVQEVTIGKKPSTTRTWRIKSVGADRLTGTLTDAKGPVTLYTRGNLLHIAYVQKGALDVEQWLYLQPGGLVALNRMVVRKLGIPIASLNETISKR